MILDGMIKEEIGFGIVMYFEIEEEIFKSSFLRICEIENDFEIPLAILITFLNEDGNVDGESCCYCHNIKYSIGDIVDNRRFVEINENLFLFTDKQIQILKTRIKNNL